MPPPDGDLSVFRTSGWTEERIWEQGKAAPGRTLKARGDLSASVVIKVEELFIDPDDEPPGHANIKGWPAGPENKSKRMELAMSLAGEATLLLSP